MEKAQVKYKIVFTFTQILSKVAKEYPMNLPDNFTEYHENTNFVAFLDVDLIPFNCVFEIDFHDKLLIMTVTPLIFVMLIGVLYIVHYGRLLQQDALEQAPKLKAKCVYVLLVVLYSVFPALSAVTLQTFIYDERLNDNMYLQADYSIQHDEPSQQGMELFAIIMLLLYCVGIPAASFMVLWWKNGEIQRLQAFEARLQRLQNGTQQAAESEVQLKA